MTPLPNIARDSSPVRTEADVPAVGTGAEIQTFSASNSNEPSEVATVANPPPSSDAERRPLTVMFCDLADSTALSTKLDPEDLQDVIRSYQQLATTVIQEYEGFIAKFMAELRKEFGELLPTLGQISTTAIGKKRGNFRLALYGSELAKPKFLYLPHTLAK